MRKTIFTLLKVKNLNFESLASKESNTPLIIPAIVNDKENVAAIFPKGREFPFLSVKTEVSSKGVLIYPLDHK